MESKKLISILEKEIKEENAKYERMSDIIRNNKPYYTLLRLIMFPEPTLSNIKYYDLGKYRGRVEELEYIKGLIEKEENGND